jgi:hypothetical protein
MRTMTQLVLVLMGGGAMAAGTAVSMESWRSCSAARERMDPRADQTCGHGGGGHGGGGSHGWFGGGTSSASTDTHAVTRGGFGFFGMHFGGFHG